MFVAQAKSIAIGQKTDGSGTKPSKLVDARPQMTGAINKNIMK